VIAMQVDTESVARAGVHTDMTMYVRTYTHTRRRHACASIHKRAHTHARRDTYTHAYTRIHTCRSSAECFTRSRSEVDATSCFTPSIASFAPSIRRTACDSTAPHSMSMRHRFSDSIYRYCCHSDGGQEDACKINVTFCSIDTTRCCDSLISDTILDKDAIC